MNTHPINGNIIIKLNTKKTSIIIDKESNGLPIESIEVVKSSVPELKPKDKIRLFPNALTKDNIIQPFTGEKLDKLHAIKIDDIIGIIK